MNVRLLHAAALIALAALPAGCGGGVAPNVPAASAGARVSPVAAAKQSQPIVVAPKSLTFTSAPKLKLKISENGYKGPFTIKISSSNVAKLSKTSVKGPIANIAVTAAGAGTATITVTDSNKRSVKVPVSVTTAVVIVN
jgi:hypothetical protein